MTPTVVRYVNVEQALFDAIRNTDDNAAECGRLQAFRERLCDDDFVASDRVVVGSPVLKIESADKSAFNGAARIGNLANLSLDTSKAQLGEIDLSSQKPLAVAVQWSSYKRGLERIKACSAPPGCKKPNCALPAPKVQVASEDEEELGGIGAVGGTSVDRVYGRHCSNGYHRKDFHKHVMSGAGDGCRDEDWFIGNDPHDCRVKLHWGMGAFVGAKCHLTIMEEEDQMKPPGC
jgi:hypothetical protein